MHESATGDAFLSLMLCMAHGLSLNCPWISVQDFLFFLRVSVIGVARGMREMCGPILLIKP